jgi:3-dehydroshikimate dehydratase
MTFRPGLVSVTFRALTVREIIALTASCDIEGIEWGGDVHVPPDNVYRAHEVAKATADSGVRVAAYGSYYHAGESEGVGGGFSAVCKTAVALGAPTIRVWAGKKNAEDASPEYRYGVDPISEPAGA